MLTTLKVCPKAEIYLSGTASPKCDYCHRLYLSQDEPPWSSLQSDSEFGFVTETQNGVRLSQKQKITGWFGFEGILKGSSSSFPAIAGTPSTRP